MASSSTSWQYPVAIGLGIAAFASFSVWQTAWGDLLGHLLAGVAVPLFCLALPVFQRRVESYPDYGTPSLRSLAWVTPPVVFLQITFGTAFRHGWTGFTPHLMGALVAIALLLYVATGVLNPAPAGHATRWAAHLVLWATILQVVFGIAAFVSKYAKDAGPGKQHAAWAHMGTGALTLGSAVLLSALLLKTVVPQPVVGIPAGGGREA